ncbi:MAG: hypothetical protein WBW32_15300 [Luteibacter sp.]
MSQTRTFKPSIDARAPVLSSDLSSAILFQLKDALPRIETELSRLKDAIPRIETELSKLKDATPRIETELKHLRKLAEATRQDVDALKTWKTLVLGGAAVLGILLGLYKATAASVHVIFGESPPVAVVSVMQPPR